MRENKRANTFWLVYMLASTLALVVCLLVALLPYDLLSQALDSLAPDGRLEFLTPARHTALRTAAGLVAAISLVLLGTGVVFRDWISQGIGKLLDWSGKGFSLWGRDFISVTRHLVQVFQNRAVTLALLFLTLLAAVLRLAFLETPVRYDEAYSFLVFAQQPVKFILTDYHVPNNHIFHTLLMRAAYLTLGSELWSLRLPVFLAGVLLVPATFLVAFQVFNSGSRLVRFLTALLAAALVAASTTLIEFSTNARGYMWVCLLTMVSLGLALYLRERPNRMAWTLLVVIMALGFFTIPIFLYTFGMIMLWLFVSCLFKDISPSYSRGQFFWSWLAAGFMTAVLVILLYLPLLLSSGVDVLVGNRFVSAVEATGFGESIQARIRASWVDWVQDVPTWVGLLLAGGFLFSNFFSGRISRSRIPFPLVGMIWVAVLVWFQQVTPWPRIWIFLLPIFLVWGAGGVIWAANWMISWLSVRIPVLLRLKSGNSIVAGSVIICLLAIWSSWNAYSASSLLDRSQAWGRARAAEFEAAQFLAAETSLGSGDGRTFVASAIPANFPLRYYLFLESIDAASLFRKTQTPQFERVYVVVHEVYAQTLADVMKKTKLDEFVQPESARLVYENKPVRIFEVRRP